MFLRHTFAVVFTSVLLGTATYASEQASVPPEGPTVSMTVTTPDGHAQTLSTHESGLATLDVNGHQYGFRPTMHDDQGQRMTVTIFDMGSQTQAVKELSEVNVTGNGPAVASKSSPSFTVKASKGAPPATPRVSQSTRK